MRQKDDMENWRKELKAENDQLKNEVTHLREVLAAREKLATIQVELGAAVAALDAEHEEHKKTAIALAEKDQVLSDSIAALNAEREISNKGDEARFLLKAVQEILTIPDGFCPPVAELEPPVVLLAREVRRRCMNAEAKLSAGNPSLDEALNSGDGSYRP
jgi:chromosome segregation ATPase